MYRLSIHDKSIKKLLYYKFNKSLYISVLLVVLIQMK